jgi:5-methylcytosine-specific restriction endonuclease McrA
MTGRAVPEWIGRTPESMPTVKVLLRIFDRQDGICACGCNTRMNFERDQIDCDHRVALKDGGENREANLQLLLRRHHITKTSAEAVARAEAERHKAKAFTVTRERRKHNWGTRPLGTGNRQHTATRPIQRKSETQQ